MKLRAGLLRGACVLAAFVGTISIVPAQWSGHGAPAWYAGDLEEQRSLARSVAAQIERDIRTEEFQTGSDLFSGEWLFGTYLMAGIGFCQLVLDHPELEDEFTPHIEHCIAELISARVREFDTRSWNGDALKTIENGRGHAAYLGYFNLLLGLYRTVDPGNRFTTLNDRISLALEARMAASANGLVETYPDEWYPMDNASILASVALHERATNIGDHTRLDPLVKNFRRHAIDPKTGLLYQALAENGASADRPRGSGSALAAFFLGFGVQPLGREIFNAIRRELATDVLGFGAIREYPRGQGGKQDIDSGPIVFGLGCSATGFSIGGARMYGDQDLFRRLWASTLLAGAPIRSQGRTEFITAGPLGNAILFAMLTARPVGGP